MSQQIHYHILFDGGSRNNGSPEQQAYGSYIICTADGRLDLTRCEFSPLTNNEAEYAALNEALYDLLQRIEANHRDPSEFSIRVVGDSLLVLNQVRGIWKCKAHNLIPLKLVVQHHLSQFASWQAEHVDRSICVRLLGH